MITYYIILLLFIVMITIFIGLHLSKGINNSTLMVLFWIIYSLVSATFFNVFLLGYFWSIVRKKTGPTGIRGIKGDVGEMGIIGKCVGNSNQNIAVFQIIEHLDRIYSGSFNGNCGDFQTDLDVLSDVNIRKLQNSFLNIINSIKH